MADVMGSMLVGTAGLMLAGGASLLLAVTRRSMPGTEHARRRAATVMAATVVVQAAHFAEEYATGFPTTFPVVLGLEPWPTTLFVAFNLAWLVVWSWAAARLVSGSHLVGFPAWFLATAAMLNGAAHPLLAAHVGGYFPGLATSPVLGVAGLWLWRRLWCLTESRVAEGREWRPRLAIEAILFSVLVPGAVTYWIPRYGFEIWRDVPPTEWSAWQTTALLPLGLGLVIYLRCVWEFAARGRGIPAPLDHPKQLVVSGLYRYVRNPMYVGVLLVLLGESTFFESRAFLTYAIGWLLVVHLNVLVYEEPNLTRKFGRSYLEYKASVRRWVPGRRYVDGSGLSP